MAKYNICEIKEKKAAYRSLVSPAVMDRMQEQIMKIIVMDKKYRDKDYSAQDLANEIGTNTRYISAVVNVRFHMNFTSFVNSYRISDAKSILVDKRYQDLNIEEVSDMVGFSNRQSFYASFFKMMHMTPRQFRLQQLALHPGEMVKPAKPAKPAKAAKDKKAAKGTKATKRTKTAKTTQKRKSSKK